MARKKKTAVSAAKKGQVAEAMPAVEEVNTAAPEAVPAAAVQAPMLLNKADKRDLIGFAIIMTTAMLLQIGDMSLVLGALLLIATVGKEPLRRLRERFSIPVVAFVAFAFVYGAAGIYANTEGAAVSEYIKFIASFPLSMLLLVRFDKKHIPGLLWSIAATCSVIAFLCIDSGGTEILYQGFAQFASLFGLDYFAPGNTPDRTQGIYGSGNITGAILGVSMLLGLYLMRSTKNLKARGAAALMLGVSAVSFMMAMSRGAIVFFGLSLLLYLIFVGKGNRVRLFMLMVVCGVSGLVSSAPALANMAVQSPIPDLMAFVCAGLIFVLDWQICDRIAPPLEAVLEKHRKVAFGAVIAIVIAGVAAVFAAVNVTGGYTFNGGEEELRRSQKFDAGSYTVESVMGAGTDIDVLIYSQSVEQSLMGGQYTELYDGSLGGANFTVDETVRVYFIFEGNAGDVLESAVVSDGTKIPLNYTFLPDSIALRLQDGLLESANFMQRVEYYEDSLKLFADKPLFGWGLGSTEEWFFSVQDFFYQSKYGHNHVLQIMTDTGIVGTVFFLGFILGSGWLLVRNLKGEDRSWVSVLLAAWCMINLHSLMELNFSIRAYQCVAYSVMMLPIIAFAQPITKKGVQKAAYGLLAAIWAFELIFGGLYFSYRTTLTKAANYEPEDVYGYMAGLETFIKGDVFHDNDYKITYVANATMLNDERYNDTAEKYVKELRGQGVYSACYAMMQYRYLQTGEYDELFACAKEGLVQTASADWNWNHTLDFYRESVFASMGETRIDGFVEGVWDMKEYLEDYNEGRMDPIELSDVNTALLDVVAEIKEKNLTGKAAYDYLAGASYEKEAE